MSTPRDIIEKIRRRDGAIRLDGTPIPEAAELLVELNNAVEKLAKEIYSKKTHFIFELIQNAEDNDYRTDAKPSLKFVLLSDDPTKTNNSGGCLCVFNNEAGFAENNVRAISTIGKSTKTDSDASGFIGEKGIGFKSVFQITSSPHIFSNGFQFKFVEKDPVAKLGYIVPYWIEEIPEIVGIHYDYTTALLLPLKRGEFEGVKAELEKFEAETILFLNKLHRLEIRTNDSHIVIKKEMNGQLCTLTTRVDDDKKIAKFWIEKNSFQRPAELEEEKRPKSHHTERELSVAFPLTEITEQEKIFAYLPTEEFPGFPFFINGDFLLSSSRESILRDNAWNAWLFEKTAQVAADGVIAMLGETDIGSKAYRFVPLEKDISPGQEAFHPLVKLIQDNVAAVPCIRGEDEVLHLPTNSRLMPPKYRSVLGDNLPSYFDDLNLAERAVNKFEPRLKPLGLDSVQQSDLEAIFSDKEWVKNRDIEWCAKVLVFLASEAESSRAKHKKVIFGRPKPYKMSLDKFAVVPAMNGQKYVGAQLFMPLSNDHQQRLAQIPNDLHDELLTIDPAISQELTKLEADSKILTDDFEVQDFSVSNFISKTMLETLNDEQLEVSVDYLKRSIKFCMSCWDELEEDGKTDILESLPLLLENYEVVALYGVADREIVTPRTWDKETGWQLVFDTPSDTKRLAVLSTFYSGLGRKITSNYFDHFDITNCPDAGTSIYNSQNIGQATHEYATTVSKEYFNNYSAFNYTNYKRLRTQTPPSQLRNPSKLQGAHRTAFVHWLNNVDKSAKHQNPSFSQAIAEWYYRTDKSQVVESELLRALKNKPWVKTSKGLKPPGQVFYNDPNLRQWFKNKIAFLEDELSDDVIDLLEIKRSATTEDLLDYLEELAKANSTEPPTEIYEYLDQHAEGGLSEIFLDKPLIFTTKNGGEWMKSSEVYWEDGSLALGDKIGWLEKIYPQSLESFFLRKLGVKSNIDIDAYANAWLELQSNVIDSKTVEAVLSKAIRELRHGHQKLQIKETDFDFRSDCQLWSLDKNWCFIEDIYINDSRELYELFKDDYDFVWTPPSLTHKHLEMFFDWLGVENISSAASYRLSDGHQGRQRKSNQYVNEYSLELILQCVAALDRDGDGDLEELLNGDLGRSLYSLKEFDIENLEIEAHIAKRSHMLPQSMAFIDWEVSRLYIDKHADRDDIKDDIAKHISRKIRGAKYKVLLPFITDILSVSTEARRRKIRDKYSWSFSRDQRKTFNAFLKELHSASVAEVADAPLNTDDDPDENGETSVDPSYTNDQEQPRTDPITDQPEVSEHANGTSDSKPNDISIGSAPNGGSNTSLSIPARSGQAPSNPRYPSVLSGQNGSRVGKSRSAGRARTLNYVKRNRMLSYVSPDEPVERDSDKDAENATARKKQGDRGERIVLMDLLEKGYLAELMPEGNHGFDIEAIHPETGELLYFEVKSLAELWDGQGVTISQTQYDSGRVKGESYFLVVVEGLNKPSPYSPEYIQDPISKINNYAFDVNWRKISTNITTIIAPVGTGSSVDVLIAETDSENGIKIIEFCQQNELDLPEIGADICDVSGRVILDNIEMVWENYAICVFIAGTLDNTNVRKADKWTFLSDDNIEEIKLKLCGFLSTKDEDVSK